MSGTNILKRAKLQLRTTNAQDDLQSKNKEKIHKVQKVNHSNCCLTIHKIAEEAGISKTVCDEFLTEHASCCSQICAMPAK